MYVVCSRSIMKLTCSNCGYEWDYQGESDYYATCPRCKTSVKVEEKENE